VSSDGVCVTKCAELFDDEVEDGLFDDEVEDDDDDELAAAEEGLIGDGPMNGCTTLKNPRGKPPVSAAFERIAKFPLIFNSCVAGSACDCASNCGGTE
jgi:hypothetical protein